jgi:hypothetical protein
VEFVISATDVAVKVANVRVTIPSDLLNWSSGLTGAISGPPAQTVTKGCLPFRWPVTRGMHRPVACAVIGRRGPELAIVSTNTLIGRFARGESLAILGSDRQFNGSRRRSPTSGWRQVTIASCIHAFIHGGAMVHIVLMVTE